MAKLTYRLACCALIAVLTGGCTLLRRTDGDQAAARSYDEWATLAGEIRADALGRDLAWTVAFFKHVDAIKPSRAEVMARHGLKNDSGVEFTRAYEAAVVETIEQTFTKIISARKPKGV